MAVVVVEGKSLKYERNPVIKGDNSKRAIESPESKTICAGLWRFDAGTSFDWTFEEGDLLLYPMEGQMEIVSEGKTHSVSAGDFAYHTKGTKAHFSTVNGVAGLYVGYPATWFQDMVTSDRPKKW